MQASIWSYIALLIFYEQLTVVLFSVVTFCFYELAFKISKISFSSNDEETATLASANMRPRSRNKILLSKVRIGDKVMVNYNYDDSTARGYWYDAIVTHKRDTRTIKELTATIYIG